MGELFFVAFVIVAMVWCCQARDECGRSKCPPGSKPEMTTYDGCQCTIRPVPP